MYSFIQQENYTLAFQVFGKGEKKLLAFHGYGQESSIFKEVIKSFPEHTIYSIDLFFHGKSEWRGDLSKLNFPVWKQILEDFLSVNQIDVFDLIGFSMGGRIALVSAFLFSEKINMLYLLAPDGIQINAWYRVATKYPPLQTIFKYFTHSETDIYRRAVKRLGKYGLIHKSILKLADTEMRTPQKRRKVYQTWMLYRFLEIEVKELAQVLNKASIKVFFFIGKYDRLIDLQTIKPLQHRLLHYEVKVLECGHYQLVHHFNNQVIA